MANERFTLGKWYVVENFPTEEKHDFQIACNCKQGSRQIAQILKRNYSLYPDLPTFEESKANAYLIAAAPAMYEALKQIASWNSYRDHPIGKAAREALAAANPETKS